MRLTSVIAAFVLIAAIASPVSLSAQSPRTVADLTSATCATTGCATLAVSGMGAVGIQLAGTFVGTVTFEASIDGRTFTTLNVLPITGVQTAVTSSTAPGIWTSQVGGLAVVRARVSAYTSGTVNVTIQAAPAGGRVG